MELVVSNVDRSRIKGATTDRMALAVAIIVVEDVPLRESPTCAVGTVWTTATNWLPTDIHLSVHFVDEVQYAVHSGAFIFADEEPSSIKVVKVGSSECPLVS